MNMMDTQEREAAAKAAAHIKSFWPKLIRTNVEDSGTLIGLPHPYIVPAIDTGSGFQFTEQFYWDSYFVALGLTENKYQDLVEGMLKNLMYLLKRFGLLPNASRMYFTGRSQPPLLTSYIFLVYERYEKSREWLKENISWAKYEYEHVWMNDTHPLWHRVYHDLSRYYDINVLHDLAEAESGWDMTTRFDRKCLDFLPVDLNSLLYRYETDFERAATILGEEKEADEWREITAKRQEAMTRFMWSPGRRFFFDYNYIEHKRGWVWSLAAYYTMWAGLATKEQATRMVRHISKFLKQGGLTTTMRPLIRFDIFGSVPTQWAHPNGWAPLHYIVIEGLKRYGYDDLARTIAIRWLNTNVRWFTAHGTFLEKYNVVSHTGSHKEGVYPGQVGFGWTNGVFMKLYEEYVLNDGTHQG